MQQETPPEPRVLDYTALQQRPQRFTKRVARAFTITTSIAIFINIAMAIAIGTSSDAAQAGFGIVNFPALPCIFGIAMLGGPPMGESEMTPFERSIPALLAIFGSVIWGLIAALFAKATAGRPTA